MSLLTPTATVRGRLAESPAAAYDRFVAVDLPALLTGYGPLPGVAAVTDPAGPWGKRGAERTVVLTDGNTARERVLTADRPAAADGPGRFAYRVTDSTNALRLLAARADGEWRFDPNGRGGTAVTWAYRFRPLTPVTVPVLWPVVAGPLRGYMKKILRSFAAGAP